MKQEDEREKAVRDLVLRRKINKIVSGITAILTGLLIIGLCVLLSQIMVWALEVFGVETGVIGGGSVLCGVMVVSMAWSLGAKSETIKKLNKK